MLGASWRGWNESAKVVECLGGKGEGESAKVVECWSQRQTGRMAHIVGCGFAELCRVVRAFAIISARPVRTFGLQVHLVRALATTSIRPVRTFGLQVHPVRALATTSIRPIRMFGLQIHPRSCSRHHEYPSHSYVWPASPPPFGADICCFRPEIVPYPVSQCLQFSRKMRIFVQFVRVYE